MHRFVKLKNEEKKQFLKPFRFPFLTTVKFKIWLYTDRGIATLPGLECFGDFPEISMDFRI